MFYFFIDLSESVISRNKQNITIIQKGRPFQNPASPVLMLQARPITNIPTSITPKKIVNFSLDFIILIQSLFYFTCQPACVSK